MSKDNTFEQSLFQSKGLSQEEVNALSDEEIMQMVIKEKRRRLMMNDSNRRAAIRRSRTVTPTASKAK